MTVHSITTDLTLIDDGTGTYVELASPYNAGGTPAAADGDYFIQSTSCATQTLSASKSGLIFSMVHDNGSDLAGSFGTDDCFFIWQIFLAGTGIDTWANGGLRVFIGADTSNGDVWQSGGSDFGRNPYGGWQNIAIDPTLANDYTIGTPTAVWRYFGSMPNTVATISKGAFHGVDVMRYGRGELIVEFGTGADPQIVFQDIADDNDSINNRWGLFQSQGSSYLWKGLMSIGNATNAAEFTDANVIIFIDDTPRTYAAFNRIEVNNTSTTIDWTAVSITAPNTSVDGTVLSRGQFEVVDNATVDMDSCTFTDMSTFTFNDGSNANTIIDTIFRRCGEITTGGATMTGCIFENITSTNHVSVTSPANAAKVSGGEFISDGTGNGLVIAGTAADFTLTDVVFTGYSLTVDANKAIYVNIATGTVNITISGGSGISADSHIRTAGATVNVIVGAVNVTVTTVDSGGTAIASTRVHLRASATTGPFPYAEGVTSITRSTTLATVTHTAHGMASNDKVKLAGITDKTEDNAVQQITVTGANTYTYTTTDSGSTSYTGDGFVINAQDETSYGDSPSTEGTFSGGTGHSVSDVITLRTGVQVTVDAVSTGVVTEFTVNSLPGVGGRSAADVLDQISSTGTGIGFSLTVDTDNLVTEIRSTFVALDGDTNGSGVITTSRVYSTDQPVAGWARKSSSSPFYKEGPINATVDSADGLNFTAVMVSDE